MSDFGEMSHHVGRKDHRCEWCGQGIPRGETFAHYKGLWEDEWQNWRMHEECYEDLVANDDGYGDGFSPYENERPTKENNVQTHKA